MMTKRVGIIGYPIGHSVSPNFQQAALDHYSMDATYRAWEVEPGALSEFVAGLRSPDTMGINVTVPHKEAVTAHLDDVDEWAGRAGAVNTVVNRNGKLTGHNTDGIGFLRALEEDGRFSPEGRKVLIIGAGGSAKGVALALAGRGVAEMTIANRTIERARKLADLIGNQSSPIGRQGSPRVETVSLSCNGDSLTQAAAHSDLLVNCTTLGMRHGPGESMRPISAEDIPSHALVFDLVYNPSETPLLREATKAGAATLGGLPMLVYQGAASFELWTGKAAPVEVMMRAATEALGPDSVEAEVF